MRIKINDKIYRLKEIESGVDSLMELVEEPKYKDGDFVYEDGRIMIAKNYPDNYYAIIYPKLGMKPIYNGRYASTVTLSSLSFRCATEAEKQLLIDAMEKDGKRWNDEKKCIEDIPLRKFKAGDKVRIKDGISSKTHRCISPNFTGDMDAFIGKELTVKRYSDNGFVLLNEDKWEFVFDENWLELYVEKQQPKFKAGDKVRIKRGVNIGTNMCDGLILTVSEYHNKRQNVLYCKGFPYLFREDWLEPYVEELKKGDLAIFWDNGKDYATIRLYDRKDNKDHYDGSGILWGNAIKFESKEQFERLLNGEL